MQVQCPHCRQVLQVTQAAEQFGCPACGGVIAIAPATMPAAGRTAGAPSISTNRVTSSAGKTLTRTLRRKKQNPLPMVAAVSVPVIVVVVVVGIVMYQPSAPPPRELSPEDRIALKAHELVAAELGVSDTAEFPETGYQVKHEGGDKWSVVSHVLSAGPVETQLLKHNFEAKLERRNDQWKLTSLTVNGRRRDVGIGTGTLAGTPGARTVSNTKWSQSNAEPSSRMPAPDEPLTLNSVARRLAGEFANAAQVHPTTVVWIIDQTSSNDSWRSEVVQNLRPVQDAMLASGGKLKMGVVGYAGKFVEVVTDEPLTEANDFQRALEKVLTTREGGEGTFTALAKAAETFGPKAARDGGYLVLVVVTDEGGDDAERIDEVLPLLKRQQAIVHVIGKETPLGRASFAPKMAFGEKPFEGADPVVNGPESPYGEMIHMGFWNMGYADPSEQLTSGFGPYFLARVCHETEGQFFAFPNNSIGNWRATGLVNFDPKLRKKYAPPYMSLADYEKQYGTNQAVQGLKQVSKLPRLELAKSLLYDFGAAGDDAALKRSLDMAQREVARIEPKLMEIFQPLKNGEKDRAKLTEPRLQAAYDLAMGRVLAARVRVEGYNQMLALLKQGKKFTRETSTTWSLKESDKIDANSTQLTNMLKEAQKYLHRVVEEHPGTPWAYLAQQELQTRMGWEWVER